MRTCQTTYSILHLLDRATSEFYFDDLYRYDKSILMWINLSNPSDGNPPSPRYDFGIDFAASDGIYVFGGLNDGSSPACCIIFMAPIFRGKP
jgi:hypothetical protein